MQMATLAQAPFPTVLAAEPAVRRLSFADLRQALLLGLDDFVAVPTQLVFLGLIYPLAGLIAARAAHSGDVLPLLWPLVAGLALLGPVVALGLTEISRRRERGEEVGLSAAFGVLRSPAILSIGVMALLLLAIFLAWIGVAHVIWGATLGPVAMASPGEFVDRLIGTPRGLALLVLGNGVGFVFAALVLSLSVVALPALLDRHLGAVEAIRLSLRVTAANPVVIGTWGFLVAMLLFCGSVPLFVGLAIVVPLLGHATWHLYRRAVAPPTSA
jgi:uncharacterized membrane protein